MKYRRHDYPRIARHDPVAMIRHCLIAIIILAVLLAPRIEAAALDAPAPIAADARLSGR